MLDIFWGSFWCGSALCAALEGYRMYGHSSEEPSATKTMEGGMKAGGGSGHEGGKGGEQVAVASAEFTAWQRNYLAVYLLAMFVDWLKGPYVYVLYESYGFNAGDIAMLFVGGFGASMVAGTVAGSLADSLGRKKLCLVFAACYAIAGLTKLSRSFNVLMVGRILSGVATSLLFSVFETWMVCEHNARGFHPDLLADTFSKATLGNGIVAVLAGLVASAAAGVGGYVAPFVLALLPLAILSSIILATWNENYGNASLDLGQQLSRGMQVIRSSPHILFLGVGQSMFEGAMYTFVFMWTPAMATAETRDTLPYGVIFAVFMVFMMIGSAVFGNVIKQPLLGVLTPSNLPLLCHALAIAAMVTVVTMYESKSIVYLAFCVFESTCGIFFPVYGTLRSKHIPEASRSTIMNLFRLPLNAFVLVVLLKVKHMPVVSVFTFCAVAHAVSLAAFLAFNAIVASRARHTSSLPG